MNAFCATIIVFCLTKLKQQDHIYDGIELSRHVNVVKTLIVNRMNAYNHLKIVFLFL
jgi:hypothetical protein